MMATIAAYCSVPVSKSSGHHARRPAPRARALRPLAAAGPPPPPSGGAGGCPPGRVLRPDDIKKVYAVAKQNGARVPWDIAAPQPALVDAAARLGVFKGAVLDVGCGLGDNGIFLGTVPGVRSVTSVDISAIAIEEAKRRLAAAGDKVSAPVEFLVGDLFNLGAALSSPAGGAQPRRRFDTLLDSSVFHCIGDDAAQRRYLAAVSQWVRPGGTAVLFCFSDANPDPWFGPRRISPKHARALWTEAGWAVESIADAKLKKPDAAGGGGDKGNILTSEVAGLDEALLMVARKLPR